MALGKVEDEKKNKKNRTDSVNKKNIKHTAIKDRPTSHPIHIRRNSPINGSIRKKGKRKRKTKSKKLRIGFG